MASAVLFIMLVLMPLFYYTPNVILGAIIVTAVVGLIDYHAAYRLWKVDKIDFLACMSAFFGVLFISVQMGLAIAIGISMLKILLQVTRPNTVIMGKVPASHSYRGIQQYREAIRIPSFLIIGVESPIYFTNSTYLQERILRWVREEEEEERVMKMRERALKCVVLDRSVAGSPQAAPSSQTENTFPTARPSTPAITSSGSGSKTLPAAGQNTSSAISKTNFAPFMLFIVFMVSTVSRF